MSCSLFAMSQMITATLEDSEDDIDFNSPVKAALDVFEAVLQSGQDICLPLPKVEYTPTVSALLLNHIKK